MNNSSIVGEILETGQSAVKQGLGDFAKTVAGQITGKKDQGTNEQANATKQKMSDDQAKQYLKDLYGPSKPGSFDSNQGSSKPSGSQGNQPAPDQSQSPKSSTQEKSPEELAKIESLRAQLHNDYYQNLVNPPKPEEENVTEKLDREDQEKQFETLQKEKKKPDPLANVKQGTGEAVVGVSG